MSDYYFSIAVGNSRALCISPLTREELCADAVNYLRQRKDGGK